MTAPAQHAAGLHADIADHRAHADALVAAYRDALARLGDPAAAFACAAKAAHTVLCHLRTAQVLAAAVQMLVEREDELAQTACGSAWTSGFAPRPGLRSVVLCTLPAGHDGDHAEPETDSYWDRNGGRQYANVMTGQPRRVQAGER